MGVRQQVRHITFACRSFRYRGRRHGSVDRADGTGALTSHSRGTCSVVRSTNWETAYKFIVDSEEPVRRDVHRVCLLVTSRTSDDATLLATLLRQGCN